ncbi:MAG TPA: acetyl-CoA carboxylase biotin carboxyl carrier protein subunit [Chloroflexi bacterium]|nr:acetyl-CoA carboxylase biotin carboxyl carrier protein subunit [Chloroflexota bacterium]HHW89004.1 biotin/lipoyl-binding protein [Chloroflexota bacterium]
MKVRVQVDGEIYEVEIGDLNSRPIQAVVAGELFTVWPEEVAGVATSTTATTPAAGEVTPSHISSPPLLDGAEETVMAPLPGDIVVVAVRAGERVEEGQLLCTLESMKMNNPVRSPRAGVVDEVFVAVGDHVNYGQPLVRLR